MGNCFIISRLHIDTAVGRAPKFVSIGYFCDHAWLLLFYSLSSIHWYPSHLQYAKDSQITRHPLVRLGPLTRARADVSFTRRCV
mgnify:CR=1 FL=1